MPVTNMDRPSMAIDSDSPVHKNRLMRTNSFFTSEEGNPTGGLSVGTGYSIEWQNGVQNPNGAILEDVIATCRDRLEFFQDSRFACDENATAVEHLSLALASLNSRTLKRRAEGTEGTYKP